jgi:hypothetical protein
VKWDTVEDVAAFGAQGEALVKVPKEKLSSKCSFGLRDGHGVFVVVRNERRFFVLVDFVVVARSLFIVFVVVVVLFLVLVIGRALVQGRDSPNS